MSANPVFSVIIPAYNRAGTIARTINSVLSQTFSDYEIIVVNDGSTDNTSDIVRSMRDPRIKCIEYAINKGQIHATNLGVQNAQGKYISFLDSDETWLPGMLAQQHDAYLADYEIGCVYTDADAVLRNGDRIPLFRGNLDGYIHQEVLELGYLVGMSALGAKKSCLDEIFPLDGIFSGGGRDDEICFQIAKRCKIKFIPEVLMLAYNDGEYRVTSRSDHHKCWLYLYTKHREDITVLCGKKTLSRHYFKAAKNLIDQSADNCFLATDACALSLSSYATIKNCLRFLLMKVGIHILGRKFTRKLFRKTLSKF